MKTIIQIILIVILTYLGQLFLPWWGVFIMAGIGGALMQTKGWASFLSGFIAVFALWFLQAYLIDTANESILSNKIAVIFELTPLSLIAVTAAIGGLSGGLGALTGKLFADLFKKKRERYSVYS